MSDGAARWQRLQEIVQATLDCPAESRAAFLDAACGGDESLRREAASLIAQDDRASGFLATPLAALAAGAVTYSPGGTATIDDSRDLTGARLGDYEIRSRLGAGGMGEVYRAHDHALHRDVAIKVLPSAFATDPERLARFEREARLLASLNHPHIGAVYGLAGAGELRGIILELIEGETLEARLAKGPLPVAQALSLAQQIARALDHAHQHGVMHRDLKPANIMLTKSGAKLLDFGLAKWGAPRSGYAPSPGSASARPEGVESVTSEGTILGTLHYMAPEQLEGQKVDARADVFAFGAVLYEMLIGKRAFDGGSAAAVMASVLNTEPAALDTVKRLASPGLERIIRKCLAKDPDSRWQSVRDLGDELQWISEDAERPQPLVVGGGARPTGVNRWAIAGGSVLALALAGWAGSWVRTTEPSPTRAMVIFPAMASAGGSIDHFDISADGTSIVYGSGRQLYLKRFDQVTDVLIPGSEGADEVAFSPDGQWVAFYSDERLLKVNVKTLAAPILLWQGVGKSIVRGTAWLDDRTIITARDKQSVPVDKRASLGQLMLVSAEGGEPQPLTTFTETPPEADHHHPVMLPGNRTLIFTVHDAKGGSKIVAQAFSPEERKVLGERRVLIDGAFDAQYVPTGHLVFAKGGTIRAVPFDAVRVELKGPEVTLVENASMMSVNLDGRYRISRTGTLVFQPTASPAFRRFVWVDRAGVETPVPLGAHTFSSPSISPDGKQMAYGQEEGGRRAIFTYEFATEKVTLITQEGDNRTPIWNPDGQRLTYPSTSSTGGTAWALLSQFPGGATERLVSGDLNLVAGTWARDGKAMIYMDGGSSRSDQLYSVSVDGNGKPTPFLHGKGQKRHPRMSPDGRWIAYSCVNTRSEVCVSNYPELMLHHQVSVEGGREPKWSSDGREIFYRSVERMFSIPVDTTRGFSYGKPRVLFQGDHVSGMREFGHDYDVAPDGRFMMLKPGPGERPPFGLRVTLNWVDELVRRVPTSQ